MKLLLHDYGNYPFTRQLAQALVTRGHSVDYVYSASTQLIQRSGAVENNGGPAITGITLDHPYEKYNYMGRFRCEHEHGVKLASLIERNRPDVVLSANTPLDAQALALQAARGVNAKFIFWMQDAIGLASRETLSKRIPMLGDLIGSHYVNLEKRLVKSSDRVVLISEAFRPLLRTWQADEIRLEVIPNWAPLDTIEVTPKDNAWSRAHGLERTFNFIYTGILGLKHDTSLFIKLAQEFEKETDVRIVIVSAGGAAEQLAQQAAALGLSNLVVLPPQPAETYAQVLGAADVLMSVLREDAGAYSVPSKVMSYLCAARPLLLSVPTGNLSAEIVLQAGAGLVSNPNDCAKWLSDARRLYREKDTAAKMAKNARNYAEEHFDIGPITDRFEAILKGALDES